MDKLKHAALSLMSVLSVQSYKLHHCLSISINFPDPLIHVLN